MRREINQYFASIRGIDALALLLYWAAWLAGGCRGARAGFEASVAGDLGAVSVRLFGSARGAIAACLKAGGIGPGDEVILAGFTCLAVPTAVAAAGARPVYADIDPRTLTTPLDSVVGRIGPRTRAVVLQHAFGNPISAATAESLRARGLLVVEDCALAAGTSVGGALVGRTADAAVFSLELSKIIGPGWGGVLAVHNEALAASLATMYATVAEPGVVRVTRMVCQTALSGLLYGPRLYPLGKYLVAACFRFGIFKPSTSASECAGDLGPDFIARLSPPQAALGNRQWKRLPAVRAGNQALVCALTGALRESGFLPLAQAPPEVVAVTPRVPFLVRDKRLAIDCFARAGIELGAWFDTPVSPPAPPGSPLALDLAQCPNAAHVSRHIVNLPAHRRLTRADVGRIIAVLKDFVEHYPDAATIPHQAPAAIA